MENRIGPHEYNRIDDSHRKNMLRELSMFIREHMSGEEQVHYIRLPLSQDSASNEAHNPTIALPS